MSKLRPVLPAASATVATLVATAAAKARRIANHNQVLLLAA